MGSRGHQDAEFHAISVQFSLSISSSLLYASAAMYMKTCTSEGQISSKSEAINMAATLPSCNCLRGTGQRTRYWSINHRVRRDVTSQSIRIRTHHGKRHQGPTSWRVRPCQKDVYEGQPSSTAQIERFSGDSAHVRIVDSGNRTSAQHPSLVVCAVTPKQEGRRTSQKCSQVPYIQSTCPNSEESGPSAAST